MVSYADAPGRIVADLSQRERALARQDHRRRLGLDTLTSIEDVEGTASTTTLLGDAGSTSWSGWPATTHQRPSGQRLPARRRGNDSIICGEGDFASAAKAGPARFDGGAAYVNVGTGISRSAGSACT